MAGGEKRTTTPRLALEGITKQYSGCLANDKVDLTIMPGEIHALLGENGAGKSTLVKYIYGVVRADAGETRWNGAPVTILNPNAARALGIGMVFQHFSLFESMTVEENIALGIDRTLAGPDLPDRIRKVSEQYGLPLDPSRAVHTLSAGEKQRIEIVRCLLQEPKLLIMDEPTSVLTPQEVQKLFVTLRQLAQEDVSILYISHKLDEIQRLCDTATIMRTGRVVGACNPADETAKTMAEMMIGGALKAPQRKPSSQEGPIRFVVRNLSMPGDGQTAVALHNIDIELRAGEILGIAGISGNGQTELLNALGGETLAEHAEAILIEDHPVGREGPGQRRRRGLAFIPEERLGHSAVPDMPLWENAFLSGGWTLPLSTKGLIDAGKTHRYAEDIVTAFKVKTPTVRARASSLSGGNLQKFVIGREILQKPGVIIVLQPTWGIDAGAAAAIHQAFIDMAAKGVAVLLISQDLDELFAICDHLSVLAEGRLSPPQPIASLTVERIGLLMGGSHGRPEEKGETHAAA